MSRLTRRDWIATAGMAVLAGCGRKNGAGYAGYALIATAGEQSISLIDLEDFRLLKQIRVNGAPNWICSTPQANRSYVLTPQTGSIHIVGTGFERTLSRRLADQLSAFRLTPDGHYVLAVAGHTQELIEAEAATLSVTRRWKLAAEPMTMDVSKEGAVAIGMGRRGIVEFVDRKTGKQNRRELGDELGKVKFRSDGKLLLVANCAAQTLTALDVPGLQVIVDLTLAMQPQNLCFNTDGGQLFLTGPGMDGIAIAFPYQLPLEIEQTVLGGRDPGTMACSENPAYLFVASASGSDVCILDVGTRKMIGVVEVGQRPAFITVTPDNQYALVLDEQSADMAVIHIAPIQQRITNAAVMRGKVAASLFTMLPVGNQPVQAAILPKTI